MWSWVEWGCICALYSLISLWSTLLPWACCRRALGKGVLSSMPAIAVCLWNSRRTKAPCCRCHSSGHCTFTGNSPASSTARKTWSLLSLTNVNLVLLIQKVQFLEPQAGQNCYLAFVHLRGFQAVGQICSASVC